MTKFLISGGARFAVHTAFAPWIASRENQKNTPPEQIIHCGD
jgi:hypothetical protein